MDVVSGLISGYREQRARRPCGAPGCPRSSAGRVLKRAESSSRRGGASGGTWDAPHAAGQGGSALRSAESEATASTAGLVATAARDVGGLNSLSGDSVLHPHPPSPSPQVTSSDPAFLLHRDAHPLSSVFEVWKCFLLCGDLVLT